MKYKVIKPFIDKTGKIRRPGTEIELEEPNAFVEPVKEDEDEPKPKRKRGTKK